MDGLFLCSLHLSPRSTCRLAGTGAPIWAHNAAAFPDSVAGALCATRQLAGPLRPDFVGLVVKADARIILKY